ncbi:MAG: hypothetical protein AAGC79_06115 [Pseudomonadota bacterium]
MEKITVQTTRIDIGFEVLIAFERPRSAAEHLSAIASRSRIRHQQRLCLKPGKSFRDSRCNILTLV